MPVNNVTTHLSLEMVNALFALLNNLDVCTAFLPLNSNAKPASKAIISTIKPSAPNAIHP
jgi:hypothetical protein